MPDARPKPKRRAKRPKRTADVRPPANQPVFSDVQIVAAVRRAVAHTDRDAAFADEVAWQLGLPTVGRGSRWLNPQLKRLVTEGLLERPPQGGWWFRVSRRGASRLAALASAGVPVELPESPRHQAWDSAREIARESLGAARSAAHTSLMTLVGIVACENDHLRIAHAARAAEEFVDIVVQHTAALAAPEPDDGIDMSPPEPVERRRHGKTGRRR